MMHGPINIRLKKYVQKMKLLLASGERNVIVAAD